MGHFVRQLLMEHNKPFESGYSSLLVLAQKSDGQSTDGLMIVKWFQIIDCCRYSGFPFWIMDRRWRS